MRSRYVASYRRPIKLDFRFAHSRKVVGCLLFQQLQVLPENITNKDRGPDVNKS